jgi:hypothetical protein
MADHNLLIPYWKRRIARIFAAPDESDDSVRRAPAPSHRGLDESVRSARARVVGTARREPAARRGTTEGRKRSRPWAGLPVEPPIESPWASGSLLVPYLKARIARAFSEAPPARRTGQTTPALAVPDDRRVMASEARGERTKLPVASKVRFPTFAAIGVADVGLPAVTSSTSVLGLELVGGFGGVGLMAVSALDLKNAKTTDEKGARQQSDGRTRNGRCPRFLRIG